MNKAVFGTIEELTIQNYQALLPAAQNTPDTEIIIRDDVIFSSSLDFPDPDMTHASLMRTTPEKAPALLDEIITYFESRNLPPIVFVCKACKPGDWARRLLAAGFEKMHTEFWMGVERAQDLWGISPSPQVDVRVIDQSEALAFAEVYVSAFDYPLEFAPRVASLQQHWIGVPGSYHYIAYVEGKPVGVCSLVCYQGLAIVGTAGIVRMRRGGRVFSSLAYRVMEDAKKHGATKALTQIQDQAKFGRLLRISGFKELFARDCYIKQS